MAKFLKPYDDSPVALTNTGKIYETTYTQRYDKSGHPYLEPTGERNLRAIINSNKDICNYEKIIRKFESTGDLTLLNRGVKGVYADWTGLPKTLIEAYNDIEDAKRIFEQLPVEDRKKYGNSFTEFLADFGSEKFLEVLGLKNDVAEVVKEEVKDNAE